MARGPWPVAKVALTSVRCDRLAGDVPPFMLTVGHVVQLYSCYVYCYARGRGLAVRQAGGKGGDESL